MNDATTSSALTRKLVWLAVIAVILFLGSLKVAENRRDRYAQEAWRQRLEAIRVEALAEGARLADWLGSLSGTQDAKQQIESELNGGEPLPVERRGDYEVARWEHQRYGTQVELTFHDDALVGSGVSYGTGQLQQVHPPPPQQYREGKWESIRKAIPQPAIAVWVVTSLVAVISSRFGRIAAEVMLLMAIACGTAWLVSPWYTVTVRGVFSNDRLFFALLMYLASIFLLALRMPMPQARARFHLRTLLFSTSMFAVLMALGPVGYVAIGAFLVGASLLAGVLALRSREHAPQPSPS